MHLTGVIVIVDGTAKKELWLGEMNIPQLQSKGISA